MPSPSDGRPSRAVPRWEDLPDYARADLASREYDDDWFARRADEPELRLTVLNLYVKLRGLDLWQHVAAESASDRGCLHFTAVDVEGLKGALRARGDFTDPMGIGEEWSSREKRADGALHFKHFSGWPENKVQAHIDPEGLLLASPAWWLVPIVPLSQMLCHAADQEGYLDVYRIRELLLDQGWDPVPLRGQAR